MIPGGRVRPQCWVKFYIGIFRDKPLKEHSHDFGQKFDIYNTSEKYLKKATKQNLSVIC